MAGTRLRNAWDATKAFMLAIAVHLLAAALIVVGTLEWRPFEPPSLEGLTIEAVIVNTSDMREKQREAEQAVEREQARQRREEQLAAQREREKLEADEAEKQRQRDLEAQKRQEDLRLQQLRQQQARDEAMRNQKREEELDQLKRDREEAARQRRIEEERMKQLDARNQAAAEAQQRAADEAAAQQQQLAAQQEFQAGRLATLGEQYYLAIQAQVTQNWLRPSTARQGLQCTLRIVQIPGGDVISANITGKCNGDEATRRSLVAAVERTGSLPYRGFEDVFQREIDFIFKYDGD